MGIIRSILAISITIFLALAPVASSFATPHGSGLGKIGMVDSKIGMDGVDCHNAMEGSASSDCKCCDTKSMCPDQVICMTKCGKLLDVVSLPVKLASLASVCHPPSAPEKPPNWGSTPPSPPPRS